jgi:hypothetical protein
MVYRRPFGNVAQGAQITRKPVFPMHSLRKFAAIPLARVVAGSMILVAAPALKAQEPSAGPADDESVHESVHEFVIEQIVIVAHKDQRSIRDVAANVTVMSREDINASLSASLSDVFRYTPGVDYESAGSRFGDEGINIRGIGGNRVAILLDGVPLSDQFDVGSFSNATRDFIDAGLIERIEVLHGPASALYGSSAIGGVVAVRTPDPVDIIGHESSGGDLQATCTAQTTACKVPGCSLLAIPPWASCWAAAYATGSKLIRQPSMKILISATISAVPGCSSLSPTLRAATPGVHRWCIRTQKCIRISTRCWGSAVTPRLQHWRAMTTIAWPS